MDADFRWRGREVSRMEAFSDAVFGFAVTLLVVSLEVPRSFAELRDTMSGFLAFGISFGSLLLVWYWHYKYFRRFGLQDGWVTVLNAVLLFVVLFYIYPLKFLFTVLIDPLLGRGAEAARAIAGSQWPLLMVIYGAGYLAVNLIFVLLYRHAYRQRQALSLNALELFDTRAAVTSFLVNSSVAVLSIAIAVIGGPDYALWAGIAYWVLGPLKVISETRLGRRRRALRGELAGAPEAAG